MTSSNAAYAVLNTNRSGVYVRAVVPAAGKITIYLNKAGHGVDVGRLARARLSVMDEIEHANPKRVTRRLTAHGHLGQVDAAALHARAAAGRDVARPKADAQAIAPGLARPSPALGRTWATTSRPSA